MNCHLRLVFIATAIAICFPSLVVADPLDGRDILKFQQRPMFNTPIPNPGVPGGVEFFNGHDEFSTAYSVTDPLNGQLLGYRGQFMADDFADRVSSPVVHVKWWGSYLNQPTSIPDPFVQRFLISFEEDIPATAGGFSRPGQPLLNQIVTRGPLAPGSGTFTESVFWPVSRDGPIYEYNAELHLGKEFFQERDTVYWLKIVALVDALPGNEDRIEWGWHNRDYTIMDPLAGVPPVGPGEHIQGFLPTPDGRIPVWHFQDDSVNGFVDVRFDPLDPMSFIMPIVVQDVGGPQNYQPPWDGPSLIAQFSKDLAFELYTIPEPGSMMLFVAGVVVCFARLRPGLAPVR